VGVLIGGVLTQAFGWQAIFLINVPVGAIIAVAVVRMVPPVLPASRRRRRRSSWWMTSLPS
jgi:predicted MFS family arabinose efflux permease